MNCPVPLRDTDCILLAHGEGGRLSRQLIRDELRRAFDNPYLQPLADGATLPPIAGPLVMTTDGPVVTPLFFPGGDIGSLAVHSAINDLAVCGAEPRYLSLACVLEEGLPLSILRRVVTSIASAAQACDVTIVTGDTKVVPRGAVDRMFLTTTGIGRLRDGVRLGADRVQPGDAILISGTIAEHGLAVLAAREQFDFGTELRSDSAPIHQAIGELLAQVPEVRFLRDPTRGGVAGILHELIDATGFRIELDESAIPLSPAVRGACELLGLDPLHIACEGRFLAVVPSYASDHAITVLRSLAHGANACRIGRVRAGGRAEVQVRGPLGNWRVLDEPTGAPLPRIC